MTGEAAAAPKEEEEAKAVAGVVEAASAEEAEAVSIDEATARHVIQCATLLFFLPERKKESEFWGATPTALRPQTITTTKNTFSRSLLLILPLPSLPAPGHQSNH
jgi:hypothetical protein